VTIVRSGHVPSLPPNGVAAQFAQVPNNEATTCHNEANT
jgi:hypothetical protein